MRSDCSSSHWELGAGRTIRTTRGGAGVGSREQFRWEIGSPQSLDLIDATLSNSPLPVCRSPCEDGDGWEAEGRFSKCFHRRRLKYSEVRLPRDSEAFLGSGRKWGVSLSSFCSFYRSHHTPSTHLGVFLRTYQCPLPERPFCSVYTNYPSSHGAALLILSPLLEQII